MERKKIHIYPLYTQVVFPRVLSVHGLARWHGMALSQWTQTLSYSREGNSVCMRWAEVAPSKQASGHISLTWATCHARRKGCVCIYLLIFAYGSIWGCSFNLHDLFITIALFVLHHTCSLLSSTLLVQMYDYIMIIKMMVLHLYLHHYCFCCPGKFHFYFLLLLRLMIIIIFIIDNYHYHNH